MCTAEGGIYQKKNGGRQVNAPERDVLEECYLTPQFFIENVISYCLLGTREGTKRKNWLL